MKARNPPEGVGGGGVRIDALRSFLIWGVCCGLAGFALWGGEGANTSTGAGGGATGSVSAAVSTVTAFAENSPGK